MHFLKSINKIIKILIFSDIFLLTGFGLIEPIFALFVNQRIVGGNAVEAARVAGLSMAVYWGLKSILQIPFGKLLDRIKGEKDDLFFIVFGNILAAIAAFGYIFSSLPWHIYILQAIYSLGMAMNIPGWSAIFTRHIDKGKEAFEWSIASTSVGVGAGAAGALGGYIAAKFGFNILFISVSGLALISSILPFLIFRDICFKDHLDRSKFKRFQKSILLKS